MPNGKPIGKKGDGAKIRFLDGGEEAGRKLFDNLKAGGIREQRTNYKGDGYRLPNGDWIGYRTKTKSRSPAIDLDIENINIEKIHF